MNISINIKFLEIFKNNDPLGITVLPKNIRMHPDIVCDTAEVDPKPNWTQYEMELASNPLTEPRHWKRLQMAMEKAFKLPTIEERHKVAKDAGLIKE